MLFHVTAQHDHQTCEGAMRARGEDVAPRNETERWLEGNDKVKVLTALGYISEHRFYAIVESEGMSIGSRSGKFTGSPFHEGGGSSMTFHPSFERPTTKFKPGTLCSSAGSILNFEDRLPEPNIT